MLLARRTCVILFFANSLMVSLAETWGNSGEFSAENPCFEPVKVALEKLKMAWPIFDGILKAWPVKA